MLINSLKAELFAALAPYIEWRIGQGITAQEEALFKLLDLSEAPNKNVIEALEPLIAKLGKPAEEQEKNFLNIANFIYSRVSYSNI